MTYDVTLPSFSGIFDAFDIKMCDEAMYRTTKTISLEASLLQLLVN